MAVWRRRIKGKLQDTYTCKFEVDGKQVWKNTGCRTERAAKAWERDYVQSLRSQASADAVGERIRQIKSGGRSIPLADGARLYLAKPLSRPPGDQRRTQIINKWAEFVAFAETRGEKTLAAVSTATAEAYAKQLQGSGLAPKTVNEYVSICRQIFAKLKRESGLANNPFSAEIIPKMKGKARRRHAFSREELRDVVAACDELMQPLAIVAACTGLRLVDVVSLTWGEIDLAGGSLLLDQSKTSNPVRCPLLPRLLQLLKTMPNDGGLLFPVQQEIHGRRPARLSGLFRRAINSSGLVPAVDDGKIRDFHSIRHAFLWMAAESGVPLQIVQKMAGHLTPAMTKIYTDHATAEAVTQAAQRIGDPFGESSTINPLAAFTTAELEAEIERRKK